MSRNNRILGEKRRRLRKLDLTARGIAVVGAGLSFAAVIIIFIVIRQTIALDSIEGGRNGGAFS